MNPAIPDDVRRFVLTSIPSVPFMEAALLFHEAPEVTRHVADVAAALYLPEHSAHVLLRGLGDMGLVREQQGRFVYAPRDPTLAALFARVARAYRGDLIGMTGLIHDQTQRNAMRFADAFKIRKDT